MTEGVSSAVRETTTPPLREGLPANYRMRADAHYIEQLDAPPAIPLEKIAVHAIDALDDLPETPIVSLVESIKRYGVLEPLLVQKRDRGYRLMTGRKRLAAAMAAGLREVPCIVHRVDDDEARVLAVAATLPVSVATEPKPSIIVSELELANSLAAVLSCTDLLSDAMPQLTRAVAVDMIRAEARRATCTLHAARVLRQGVPEEHRFASPRQIVQRVADTLAPDARLRAIRLETSVNVADGAVVCADEELLAYAMSGVVLLMSAAVNRVNGAHLNVTATAEAEDRVTFAVVQESVVVPQTWLTVAAQSPVDSPDSHELVPLVALRLLAEAYGGRVVISRLPHASRVSVELPLQPSR